MLYSRSGHYRCRAYAGGVSALQQVLATLPADLPAAMFITMHMFNRVDNPLAAILDKAGPLRARYPSDGELIQQGCIYIAFPNYHLMCIAAKSNFSEGQGRTFSDRASMSCFVPRRSLMKNES